MNALFRPLLLALALVAAAAAQPPAPDSQTESSPTTTQATQPTTTPATQPSTTPASQPTTTRAAEKTPPPVSQPVTQPASRPAESQPATAAASQPAKKDRWLAVVGGRVHTVTGPLLERATVLSKNGVITAVGQDVHVPPEAEVIDARGLYVYPGLIAAVASGIHGGGEPQDTTNVFGLNMLIALAGGITTSVTGNTAAKLTFGTTEDMLLKSNLFVDLPYSTRNPVERARLRADLERVRNYLRDVQRHEREKATNKNAKPPDKEWLKDRFEQYRKLLTREAIGITTANTAQELRAAAALAEQFGFDLVVRGAHEGWIAAPQLGRAGVRAVITAREDTPPDQRSNRPSGASIENARILQQHGVPVAVIPPTPGITLWGLAGRDLLHLNMEAAFTVRGGLSNDAAIRTITIDAARVLGIDDRVGSLEVGKDADLVVCDGDLLHYLTQVRYTVVAGRIAYDKTKDTYFAHIRPTGKLEVPQFDDVWPRRLEWPEEAPVAAPATVPAR